MDSSTTTSDKAPTEQARSLKGNLGAVAITLMVIAAAAPLTVIGGLVPIGILVGNGIGFPVMFVVATIILLLFAVGLTTMSQHLPKAGSFFVFATHGLGRAPGLATAYLAVVCYTTVQIAVFSYLGATLSSSIELIGGPAIPWWLLTLLNVAIVGLLGYRRIELSSRVLVVVLLAEIGIVVVLGVVILLTGGAQGVTFGTFVLQNILAGAPALGLMFAIASFIGFESTVVYRDETRDPERTIPRATYASAIVIGLFYTFASWTIIVGLGEGSAIDEAAADPTTLVARVTEQYLGPVGSVAVALLFLGSMFAAVLSLHNVLTRYQHSMANARVLPERVGRVHASHSSPHVAAIVQVATAGVAIIALAFIGFSPESIFSWFAGIGTLAIVVLMAVTCLSVIVYFRRRPGRASIWKTVIAPALAFIGLLVSAVLIAANFPLLVGDVDDAGDPVWGVVSIALIAVVVIAPIVGLVQAVIMRRRAPAAYDTIVTRFDELA